MIAYYFKYVALNICFLLLITHSSLGQIPILERNISVRFNNDKITQVLDIIASEGGFNFSYNSNLIDSDRRIDLAVTNRPVRDVLKQIFGTSISYKVRGQYVILQKNITENQNLHFVLSGYIVDPNEGIKLPDASIYEKTSLASAISNQFGFYKIKLSTKKFPIRLSISKPGYEHQIVFIKNAQNDYLNIELVAEKKELTYQSAFDDNSIEQMELFQKRNQLIESAPVFKDNRPPFVDAAGDESFHPVFVPFDSLAYRTDWERFKDGVGKFFVRRSQRINAFNINDTLNQRLQISLLPFLGTNRLLSGSIVNDFSVNILMGYSGGVNKLEIGGLLNGIHHDANGLQIAGLGNIVGGQLRGVQVSSLLNIAGSLDKGLQLSDGINVVAKTSNGWQVGIINFAKNVGKKGKQIGLLNISETSESTPFGLLSFVSSKDGYKRLELTIDENETGSVTFKTGVRKFYNILTIGYNFLRTRELFSAGYGIGRAYEMSHGWMLNTDLVANVLVEYDAFNPNVGALYKFDISFEKQIARNAAITFGPSFKALLIDRYNFNTWQGKPFSRMPSYTPLFSTDHSTFWLGFQMGLRIRSK